MTSHGLTVSGVTVSTIVTAAMLEKHYTLQQFNVVNLGAYVVRTIENCCVCDYATVGIDRLRLTLELKF